MKTKEQVNNNINLLIDFIKQNKQSLLHPDCPSCSAEIMIIKKYFYITADDLTPEFTEQELYRIETDLLFYYKILKKIIDTVNFHYQNNNPIQFTNQQYNFPHPPQVEPYIIQQKHIEDYTTFLKLRIAGIIEEIEKKQEMQLRNIAKIYNGLADNLDQQMMAMDEQLYDRQTQRHETTIKNIIDVLDGV